MNGIVTRAARAEVRLGTPEPEVTDRSTWDWYADSCSCGLPPGECREHPRGRASQRPPRATGGSGPTLPAAGPARRGPALLDSAPGRRWHHEARLPDRADRSRYPGCDGRRPVGPDHCRAPWNRPWFESSKRRVEWPNGARAICLSGEQPERTRGPNIDTLWADELACWKRAQSTWDLVMLALRAGTNPQAMITTTPRRLAVLRRILAETTTVQTTDSTYANKAHLAPAFLTQIVSLYENTKLGRQEIYAEFLDTTEGVWFARFDPARHVSVQAEYDPIYHVRCAIDAGTSRHTAAVFYQIRHNNGVGPPRVTVFGDYHALDVVSRKNAFAIKELANQLPCHGKIDCVRLDPAAAARTSLGPAAYAEYEQVFGSRLVARWPRHLVLDGLEMLDLLLESGNLLIHPRCMRLRDAFQNYARQRRGGEWIDYPADGHPEEDMIDALRGGVRDAFPEGLAPGPRVH